MEILQPGFEESVRSRFGIDFDDLPDDEINLPLNAPLAEAKILKRVPDYQNITDNLELLYLQNAVVSQICYLLCFSMPKRLNLRIAISDVRLEKEKISWEYLTEKFLSEVEENLGNIESVSVDLEGYGGENILRISRSDRNPIGGFNS